MVLEVWTEKYRPKKLDDVVNQKHVVERLRAWVKEGSIPNMMFAGRAGVGKTTIALALAKELFGEHWKENFQETNASDERGIDVVRGKIKNFARTMSLASEFKIVFLDECDALTPEAQQALRRTMEKFSGVCRFILSCNYSSKVIEPIQSRCAVFRFKSLSQQDVIAYMERIVKAEKLKADPDALEAIFEVSEGDLRRSTNLLQAAAAMGHITRDVVYDTAARAKPGDVKKMMELAVSGKFGEARKKLYDMIINQGLSGTDVIREMHSQLFEMDIPETHKLALVEKMGDFEFRLNQGGTPEIQIGALLAQMAALKK